MLARSLLFLFLSISLGVLTGCSKDDARSRAAPTPQEAPAGAAAGKGHAPAGIKPGSHEDWCEEHGVPESQCSRCNPDLIPAFKATGDWCPEHGLPESQCKICNPGIEIKRPPKGA
jgi:hypothetical protein